MKNKAYWLNQSTTDQLRTFPGALSGISIRNAVVVTLLLVTILIPRFAGLDRLITPDENRWLARSANFYYALTQGNFADTYQIEHPGVLTMWAGAFAFISEYPDYAEQAPGQIQWWRDELGPLLREHGYDPLAMLVAARLNMIAIVTLVLINAFGAASRLFGFWPATIGFLLIALDPFHIALSRLLHVDGLPSSLVLLSLLAFLNHRYRGQHKRDLVISGIAAGLAWLTKSPMLFLIPFVGLLLCIELIEKWIREGKPSRHEFWQACFTLIVWGSVGLAVFVILWPSTWMDPVHTVRRVLGGMVMYAEQGHDSVLYFNGKLHEGDPGVLFYPIAYLWRSTPIVLLGLTLATLALSFSKWRWIAAEQLRPLAAILLFSVLFTTFMTLGAKKFDRYLLPIYPALDLVAGVGLVAAANWVRQRVPTRWVQVSAPALLLVTLAVQAASTVSSYPYYLSHYNPLLGGIRRAPEVMMVGWGEGLDQAARFLNNQPAAEERQVVTGAWSTTFSYYYNGPVLSSRFEPETGALENWIDSDYYVLYINEQQRGKIPAELITYLATLKPAHVVRINGLDYVYVYDISNVPPPEYLRSFQRPGSD